MCGCNKKKVGVNMTPKNTPKRMYDFTADTDFVLVESRSRHYKDIKSPTLTAAEMLQRYGKRSYGTVAYGTRFNMLRDDYEYYSSHNISGVDLVLVSPVKDTENTTVNNDVKIDLVIENMPNTDVVIEDVVVSDLNPNDLTVIKGIGLKTEQTLNELGFNTLHDLLNLTYEQWHNIRPASTEEGYNTMINEIRSLIASQ